MEEGVIPRRERKKREKTEEIAVFSEFSPRRFVGAVDMNSREKKNAVNAISFVLLCDHVDVTDGDNFDLSFADTRLERRLSPNSCVPRNSAKFLLVNG